jgi:LysR family transcriptional regulator, glycine cleavage system transcriptional activator
LQLPDIDSLRCFEAAAVALNFRRAARLVALSPAALSDRIRRLEDQIGQPLFHRTTRRVTLTVAGERLLPRVRLVLETARRCLEPNSAEGAAPPFELMLGTRFELGLSWLTPALTSLRKARPERTLHLYFGDSDDLLSRVRQGALDCAVSSVRLSMPGLRYELLHREDYALVATAGLLARAPLRRPADAGAHTLIDSQPDLPLFRYFLDARPAGEPWAFARIEYMGTIAAVRYRVLEGAGLAVLPRYFVGPDLERGRLKEPLPRAALQHDHFRLIWRVGHQRDADIRSLAGELRALPLV